MAYERSALGITGIQQVAEHLADFGRFGDGYVVHASKGETVIPLAVLNENPRLKAALFTQMRDMGLEPKRYVVGDKLNSINPVTGQPEFFFKKLFKGLKKVVKTIAPVVLPVALSMTRLGPIFGAAAGTGIASLIGGESFGKSLKNSVIAGGIGGLYAGLTGAYGAGEGNRLAGFKKGVSDAFKQPFAARAPRALDPIEDRSEAIGTDTGPDATSPVDAASEISPITAGEASAPFGQLQPLGAYEPELAGQAFQTDSVPFYQQRANFRNISADGGPLTYGASAQPVAPTVAPTGSSYAGQPFQPQSSTFVQYDALGNIVPYQAKPLTPNALGTQYSPAFPSNNAFLDSSRGVTLNPDFLSQPPLSINNIGLRSFRNPTVGNVPILDKSVNIPPLSSTGGGGSQLDASGGGAGAGDRGRFAKARDLMVRGGLNPDQVEGIKRAAYDKALLRTGDVKIADAAYNAAGPGILAKYGPSTALGLGAAGLFGAFEPGEEPEPVDFYDQMYGPNSALGRLQSNPGLFSVGIPSPAYTPATLDDIRYSAMGGPINQNNFPPRIGAINGPGTGTSDDIPAMLSDGEYVMTAKAVRGAGNGNRKQGMQNMYNMMRQFEGQTV